MKKYTQLSAKPTSGESSTGLGLSLVKHLVKLMQGDVQYEPNPQGGSIFQVQLEAA